jgi:DNA ligase 4
LLLDFLQTYSHFTSTLKPRRGKSPGIQAIDALLDELASLSAYSNLGCLRSQPRRSRASILRDLYLELDPLEAKFLTQIILKDLRPVLYPLTETHTTKALLHYNSNALHVLSKWEVMRAWHSCMPRIYRVRATLDEAARAAGELPPTGRLASDHDVFLPVLRIPIEVHQGCFLV